MTIATIGLGALIFPQLAGSLEDVQAGAAVMIQALAATAVPPGVTPIPTLAPSPQTTATPTPTPAARSITLSFSGQVNLDSTLRKAGVRESNTYDYSDIFTQIAPYLSKADLTLVTVETVVAGDIAGFGSYNAPDAILSALRQAGVDVINVATERILDIGITGLNATYETGKRFGFDVIGINVTPEGRYHPLIVDVKGVKTALLSYTYGLSSTGSKQGTASQREDSVNIIDAARIRSDVAYVREQGAQLVIVNAHWGKRNNTKPAGEVQRLVDDIANCGVDVIIGTHPTSVHPFETRTVHLADGTEKDIFIAYSMGNLLTNERDEAKDILGSILTLTFTQDPGSSTARLTDARYMPTWVMRYQSGSYQYRILPAGTEQQPPEMTNTIYRNMRRAYEALLKQNGTQPALPVAE